jgi:hypothetical protein
MTVEEAYAEMRKRGWGFARNRATGMIAIGPYDGVLVDVLAMDTDPVRALEKAIEKAKGETA